MSATVKYPNLIKSRYPHLKGSDWIRRISEEDRKALIEIGLQHTQYGHLGGVARAKKAKRDERGRFA